MGGSRSHMHTMLHQRWGRWPVCRSGVHVDGTYYYVLDVAAYWGDAGLTPQPTNLAYGENAATQQYVSQYIAPVIKADPREDGSIVHTVQSGQSLWMLAEHYDVDINVLRQLNGLGTSDMIYIGQKIMIRGPSPEPLPRRNPLKKILQEEKNINLCLNTPFTPAPADGTVISNRNGYRLGFQLLVFDIFWVVWIGIDLNYRWYGTR